MLIVTQGHFICILDPVVDPDTCAGKIIARLRENEALGVIRKYKVKSEFILVCSYCGALCTHYGYTHKVVFNPGTNLMDVLFLQRCQCSNPYCVCRVRRDQAKSEAESEKKGKKVEYVGCNVTHVVFPDFLMPFKRYPAFFIETVALLRPIVNNDYPDADKALIQKDPKVIDLKEFFVSSYGNYIRCLSHSRPDNKDRLRKKSDRTPLPADGAAVWQWLCISFVYEDTASYDDLKTAEKFEELVRRAAAKLKAEKEGFFRSFLRRIRNSTAAAGFTDLSRYKKRLEFVARITHLHFMNRLLLSRFVPKYPTYYLGYRYYGFANM